MRDGADSQPFRGAWTLTEDGDVIQHFQIQPAGGGDWADWFIGRYTPMGEGEPPETADPLPPQTFPEAG